MPCAPQKRLIARFAVNYENIGFYCVFSMFFEGLGMVGRALGSLLEAKLASLGAKLAMLGPKLAMLGVKLAMLGTKLALLDAKLGLQGHFGLALGHQQGAGLRGSPKSPVDF